jgi:hypothetical protein
MRILAIALVIATFTAQIGYAQTGLVQLAVPSNFEGPQRASESGAQVEAYVHRIPGTERSTLLQISTYDFGAKLKDVPKEELGNGAEHYLLQFLGGIERRRTEYHGSSPTRVLLGGIPAARAEWTGKAKNQLMSGVMYCVIVGTTVVAFHTQGFSDSAPSDRTAAIRAIESVTFRPED